MKLLAIETATDSCSVALLHDDDVREDFREAPRRQTELVLPMVEGLLAQAGWSLRELDGIAFGHGPGAFTGVRVAVSVTQGLARAAELPVVGISTLEALALDAFARGVRTPVLAALDARLGELYLAVYGRLAEDRLEALLPDCLCHPDALPSLPAGIRHAGGSGEVYREQLGEAVAGLEWLEGCRARARHVARLAAPRFRASEGLPAERAQPVYLRDQVIQGAVR